MAPLPARALNRISGVMSAAYGSASSIHWSPSLKRPRTSQKSRRELACRSVSSGSCSSDQASAARMLSSSGWMRSSQAVMSSPARVRSAMVSASSVSHSACRRRNSPAPASSNCSTAKWRTVSSIMKRPSRRRSRLLSTRAPRLSSVTSQTPSAASSVQPPTKTPSRTNAWRSSGPSRSKLQWIVAASVCWRAGASRGPLGSMFGSRSSRSRISPGASSFARAAASSIASGSPSSCLQTRATSGALAVSSSNSGSTACARAVKRRTASVLTSASNGRSASGSLERRHRVLALGGQPQRRAARGQDPHAWGRGEEVADEGCSGEDLLEVVQHEQHPPLAQMLDHALGQVPLALAHVERLGDRRHQELRARDRREADEQRTVAELGLELVRDRQPDSRLARASRAGEGDEPRALVAEQRADCRELEPAADERRGGHRQRLRRAGRRFRSGEARVLPEDRPLQLLQGRARIEAEILREGFAGFAIDLERVRLAAAAVEREHPLLEEPLAIRLLGRERFELGDDERRGGRTRAPRRSEARAR